MYLGPERAPFGHVPCLISSPSPWTSPSPSQKVQRDEIQSLVARLEPLSPVPAPLDRPDLLAGTWRVAWSTVAVLGSRRTKLGLRGFVTLGEMTQTISPDDDSGGGGGDGTSVIAFSVSGTGVAGALTLATRYAPATSVDPVPESTPSNPSSTSSSRVDVRLVSSDLAPAALRTVFEGVLPLLLDVFDPEGWLDITYIDAGSPDGSHPGFRLGRDDKGNVFALRRIE